MEGNKQLSFKWLWGLLVFRAVECLLPLLGQQPLLAGGWYPWARQAVSLGIVVCLYLLPGRYRLAGMVKALSLMCVLISLAVYPVLYACGVQLTGAGYAKIYALLAGASEVLALIAMSLEYITHASTVPGDKSKWYIFLGCSLAVTVLSSVSVALMQPLLPAMTVQFIRLWNFGTRTLSLAVSVIYFVLLYRVIDTLRRE